MRWPPNERAAGSGPVAYELLATKYNSTQNKQGLCDRWAAEGRRLLREYQRWQTLRHYRAYLLHCAGIGSRIVGKGGLTR